MAVATVPGVDDRDTGILRADQRRPLLEMAHGDNVGEATNHRTVSATVSPFDTDDEAASEKPMTLPPSSSMAEVKLSRVRVEGS